MTRSAIPLVSPWIEVTQAMIDDFSRATLDADPMHVDPDWAARGPFGVTVAFGFQTLGLLTHMLHAARGDGPGGGQGGYHLNYGLDRVRFLAPLKSGSRVRGVFQPAKERRDARGRVITTFTAAVEVEGQAKPALAAEWLVLWVPPEAG